MRVMDEFSDLVHPNGAVGAAVFGGTARGKSISPGVPASRVSTNTKSPGSFAFAPRDAVEPLALWHLSAPKNKVECLSLC